MTRSQLSRAFEEAAGPDREVCFTCLGPRSPEFDYPALVLHDDEPAPECPTCGQAVDHEGRSAVTLGPDGNGFVSIIVLQTRPRPVEDDE